MCEQKKHAGVAGLRPGREESFKLTCHCCCSEFTTHELEKELEEAPCLQ